MRVTSHNVDDLRDVLEHVKTNADRIIAMTAEYPVIIEFCGYRRIVRSRDGLDELVNEIEASISAAAWTLAISKRASG